MKWHSRWLVLWVGYCCCHAVAAGESAAVVFEPRREAVLSAEVSARVVRLNKRLGQSFAAGEVLTELENFAFEMERKKAVARLAQARAQAREVENLAEARVEERKAEAALKAARAALTATERLYESKQASQIDLEQAHRDTVVAEAQLEAVKAGVQSSLAMARSGVVLAEAELAVAERHLNDCRVHAPFAGRIAKTLAREHELVGRGTPLVEVIDDSVLRARFLLPGEWIKAVSPGREVVLEVSETEARVVGRITNVSAVLDPASVTFEVWAEVENADGALRAGMNGTLSLSELKTRAVE